LDSFENTHDLLGDLFGAKNAGVTAWVRGSAFAEEGK
jgi:hypothetical protein